ncbi:MAG: Fe-S cluster assembly ATPase SufC [Candidatus Methanomethyliaceae archaeon]|nr:Fe-S cluster assembly ATPase SufC [Candidatus Methanomethyliaceae archaeon]MDW7970939.1 Fe-S cluster assembly ATPase SufC [Nitrososphaerota archaeon]
MNLLLEVQDLHVSVEGKEILKGINLKLDRGEVIAIMGHNASGKTTLANALIGLPQYIINKGKILFEGMDITNKPIYERAKMGIAMAFQSPPSIRGLKLGDMIALAGGINPWKSKNHIEFVMNILDKVNLNYSKYMDRDLNVGFSGGERKRSELAQIFAMRPKLMILDEVDSGVDIDSLRILGDSIREYIENNNCSSIIITHHRHILQYIKPKRLYIMSNGRIVLSGTFEELISKIEALGYEKLIKEVLNYGLEGKTQESSTSSH